MKTLLLAGAVMAAVGCQSEPPPAAVRVPAPKTSTEPGSPAGLGSVEPVATYDNHAAESTTTTTEAPPPETTTTTEPILCPGYSHPLHHLSCDEAAAQVQATRSAASEAYEPISPQAKTVGRGSEPAANDVLACIRSYEQGADGYATDTGNGYGGAYQFDQQTWSSVGGSGRPADASPAEQDKRAQMLLDSRGLAPWPTPARQCS